MGSDAPAPTKATSRRPPLRVVLADDHPIWRDGVARRPRRCVRGRRPGRRRVRGHRGDPRDPARTSWSATCRCRVAVASPSSGVRRRHADRHPDRQRAGTGPARRGGGRADGLPHQVDPGPRAARCPEAGRGRRAGVLAAPRDAGARRVPPAREGGDGTRSADANASARCCRSSRAGYPYKEVGAQLHIAAKTVENHVRNILDKLHLERRQELVRYAVEHGIELTARGSPRAR